MKPTGPPVKVTRAGEDEPGSINGAFAGVTWSASKSEKGRYACMSVEYWHVVDLLVNSPSKDSKECPAEAFAGDWPCKLADPVLPIRMVKGRSPEVVAQPEVE
eukprot:1154888-Pelagomonas_calceolata.AAC.4